MTSSPTFSIIIPVYNAKEYLADCIDSIVNQSFTDFECILIDDGSSDGSAELCDEFSKKDSRFKTVHIANNGVSFARNVGLKNSLGRFITFADSDDSLIPTALETYFNVFNSNNRIDAIRSGYNILIDNKLDRSIQLDTNLECDDKSDLFNVLEESRYYSFVWNMCIRRSVIDKIWFNESINWLEDHIFSYQCYLKCRKVYLLANALYNYNIRTNKSSLSKAQDPEIVYKAMELEYTFKNELNNHKYPNRDAEIDQNYRRNVHRIVCQVYYGDYPFKYRKTLSNKSIRIHDGMFREDSLYFNNTLPFFLRDMLIRLLLKIKGSFAPYE